mgnify:CR=1 FL=1
MKEKDPKYIKSHRTYKKRIATSCRICGQQLLIPEEIRKEIISPYISVKDSEARISVRIKDSTENLRRNDLIKKIKNELILLKLFTDLKIAKAKIIISGSKYSCIKGHNNKDMSRK